MTLHAVLRDDRCNLLTEIDGLISRRRGATKNHQPDTAQTDKLSHPHSTRGSVRCCLAHIDMPSGIDARESSISSPLTTFSSGKPLNAASTRQASVERIGPTEEPT